MPVLVEKQKISIVVSVQLKYFQRFVGYNKEKIPYHLLLSSILLHIDSAIGPIYPKTTLKSIQQNGWAQSKKEKTNVVLYSVIYTLSVRKVRDKVRTVPSPNFER